eukprot:91111-Chlamydomonas_euryale.AAC.5
MPTAGLRAWMVDMQHGGTAHRACIYPKRICSESLYMACIVSASQSWASASAAPTSRACKRHAENRASGTELTGIM